MFRTDTNLTSEPNLGHDRLTSEAIKWKNILFLAKQKEIGFSYSISGWL